MRDDSWSANKQELAVPLELLEPQGDDYLKKCCQCPYGGHQLLVRRREQSIGQSRCARLFAFAPETFGIARLRILIDQTLTKVVTRVSATVGTTVATVVGLRSASFACQQLLIFVVLCVRT